MDFASDAILSKIGLRERLGVALVLALAILYLDFATPTTLLAPVMYIPVAGIFYGVRSPSVFIGYGLICTIFSAIAGIDEVRDRNFDDMLINRSMAALCLYAMCFLIHRNGQSATVLQLLATTDPLTGTFNRRHYMELMGREQRRADRYNIIYSVLMIDIDDFKQVNDTYGHQIGDQAIQAMARACKSAVRPTDIVARYGGEEFIITLTHTEREGALRVAERVREAVGQVAIPTEKGPLTLTISIGVSSYVKPAQFDQIIGRADAALYRAKTSGRNRVCVEDGGAAAPVVA